MALPASGQITLTGIRNEYGGAAPHGLKEYYRGGSNVPNITNNTSIPTSGQISIKNFYSSQNAQLLLSDQSNSGCYSAQTGVAISYYSPGGAGTSPSVYLDIGTWPSDPPNCQYCYGSWLQFGGKGSNLASNDNTSNIYRQANSVTPYWAFYIQINIGALSVGSVNYYGHVGHYTYAYNWYSRGYTSWPNSTGYVWKITKLTSTSIQLETCPEDFGMPDSGGSLSLANWWYLTNQWMGVADPKITDKSGTSYFPGSKTLSWTLPV